MKIQYISKVEGTPILPFIIDSYTSLRQAGNIEACEAPVSGAEEAFYIENRQHKVVAVLSFWKSTDDAFTVNMGFVLKPYRKKGYYRALWEKLVEEGRKRGLKRIIGYHKPGNSAILAFNEKVGRTLKYVCSEFTL